MKAKVFVFSLILTGCVDFGSVGINPSVKMLYLEKAGYNDAYDCIKRESAHYDLQVEYQDTSQGNENYHLLSNSDSVSWFDITHGSSSESVNFYYGSNDKKTEGIINKIIEACQTEITNKNKFN
jgi:hypothetical protein